MTLTRTPIFVTLGGWRRSFPLARPLARNGIKGDKATIECIGQLPKRPER
jgi:hypothetical protein